MDKKMNIDGLRYTALKKKIEKNLEEMAAANEREEHQER